MRPYPRGVTRTADGWRTSVMVDGRRHRQHWPPDTSLDRLSIWIGQVRAMRTIGLFPADHQPARTFRQDVTAYLERVRTLPTYRERARDLGLWLEVFGDRLRSAISASDIRAVRERWLTEGPRMRQVRGPDGLMSWQPQGEPLAASTVNHRLRALANIWTVLDGPRAVNPVRDVPEAVEPDPEPRAVDYATIRALLASIQPGLTHARLALIAYTGLPPKSVAHLRPEHVDRKTQTLWVAGRRKGRGTQARVIPLVPQALEALRELERHDGWGPYSTSSARKTLMAACRRLRVPPIRPYDLRHSWLTLVAASSGDERAVQDLAGHQDIRTTRRYTLASVAQRLAGAVAAAQQAARRSRRAPRPAPRIM